MTRAEQNLYPLRFRRAGHLKFENSDSVSEVPNRIEKGAANINIVKFALLFLIVSLTGCATTEPTELEVMQKHQVRLLAMSCFQNNEGFWSVYGSAELWKACLVQAKQKVRITYR